MALLSEDIATPILITTSFLIMYMHMHIKYKYTAEYEHDKYNSLVMFTHYACPREAVLRKLTIVESEMTA